MQINSDKELIKACLEAGYRIGIVFIIDGEEAEYHFVLHDKYENVSYGDTLKGLELRDENTHKIFEGDLQCIMYVSILSDPLKLSGVTIKMFTFLNSYVDNNFFYSMKYVDVKRREIKVYPPEWYPWFESDDVKKLKIEKIKDDVEKIIKEVGRQREERKASSGSVITTLSSAASTFPSRFYNMFGL